MKIILTITYHTNWGETLYVYGASPQMGNGDENQALEMTCTNTSTWILEIDIPETSALAYHYIIKNGANITRREWGKPHSLTLDATETYLIEDEWQNEAPQQFLYTTAFSQSFFKQTHTPTPPLYKKSILLKIICPYIKKNQTIILCGSSKALGEWKVENALHLIPSADNEWQIAIDASLIKTEVAYKLAIYDLLEKKIIHWGNTDNQLLYPLSDKVKETYIRIETRTYQHEPMEWKAAGVSIPVFSLRSRDSFGIGEFSDIKKLVDWVQITNQQVIQLLPINDTTITYTWLDSYPYNAISTYALHPIYIALSQLQLKDVKLNAKYKKEAEALNKLTAIDYQKIITLKWRYLKDLFDEQGEEVMQSKEYQLFYTQNSDWLLPYACFSYLRDKYKTADHSQWLSYKRYNATKLTKLIEQDAAAQTATQLIYFVQYLLHTQLVEAKEYAHSKGIILKGDIPIGISRNSVEAWTEPQLFNMDVQTGAPPDDFSYFGQNWGFPTYNWDEMAKDNYLWWTKRFRKMADYFDAYRIDHILGFFRIWEIPLSSVQGLLGYFNPALPLSIDEIEASGVQFDLYRMTKPYIRQHFLAALFGEYTNEVINEYFVPISSQGFALKEKNDTQLKIQALLEGKADAKNTQIRNGLYALCNEVLFVCDKREPNKYHPRIAAQHSYSFGDLGNDVKETFNSLYNDFFYHRHSQFWGNEALKKLPTLIASTDMLVCGEDLGMIPDCVAAVMQQLQILSLEIERMPKTRNVLFENQATLPYLSVSTTSTHDMAPIRTWWNENREVTQQYYNQVLWKEGTAPKDCPAEICKLIVSNHLHTPTMLTILPLQDWLSISDKLRRTNAEEERINVPAVAQHYWQYRMHLSLEELLAATEFNQEIAREIELAGRKA